MLLLTRFYLLLPFLVLARSELLLSRREVCFSSIFFAFTNIPFAVDNPLNPYIGECTYPPKALSMYATGSLYCTHSELHAGLAVLSQYCDGYMNGAGPLPLENFAANLTSKALAALPVVELMDAMTVTEPHSTAFVLSRASFNQALHTEQDRNYEYWRHYIYSYSLYGFWAIVLLTGMVSNLASTTIHRSRSRAPLDTETGRLVRSSPGLVEKLQHYLASYIVVPFSFGSHHQRSFYGFTVPTRPVGLVIGAYWALNIILGAVNYRAFQGNINWPLVDDQYLHYLADRAGLFVITNLTLIWMFAGRNNIFIWATGWSFSTFNLFHRNIARITVVEAIIHGSAHSAVWLRSGKSVYDVVIKVPFITMGILTVVTMSAMVIFSMNMIRKRGYELRLIFHILMAFVIISALFHHLSVHVVAGYYNYLRALVAIWSIDRALRILKIVYCNIQIFGKGGTGLTQSTAYYFPAADLIKLVITPGSTVLKPTPGDYFFVYQPMRWKGWENHPFTLAAWHSGAPADPGITTAEGQATTNAEEKPKSDAVIPNSDAISTHPSVAANPGRLTLEFWIRPMDGWTRELRQRCMSSGNRQHNAKIYLEGPYGHNAPLQSFETILMIAGGTGITALNPHIQEHLRRKSAGTRTRTRSIHLILTAKQPALIKKLARTELLAARQSEDVRIDYYSTGHDGSNEAKAGKGIENAAAASGSDSPIFAAGESTEGGVAAAVYVIKRRPDIMAAVLDFARANIEGAGSERAAVMVCGPPSVADAARLAAKKALRQGARLEYFEESFG